MFWTIFDTSTKRDYYRDVHNLLALPPGATIRYDYNQNHMSAAALAEAAKGDGATKKVLVAYAQDKGFRKGGADPVGPIPYAQGLWIGTRLANLSHLRFEVNRYYFDLELLDYPAGEPAAFERIMQALSAAEETPFAKWIAVSPLDAEFNALSGGTTSANWAATIDRLGTFPSQFAGDSFWRVAKIARSWPKANINPSLNEHTEVVGGREVTTAVDAVYPIFELDRLSVQIESRKPEAGEESRGDEPAVARSVTFAAADGPVKDFNGKTLVLRRYATDWIETEVAASDRVDTQHCEVTLTTGPAVPDAFPIGPELRLKFEVTKRPGAGYFALIFAIAAVICGAISTEFLKDHIEIAILLIGLSALLFLVAGFMWTGRIRLPGAK